MSVSWPQARTLHSAGIHADMTIKERALALLTPPTATPGRYKPTDEVLAYLDSLG